MKVKLIDRKPVKIAYPRHIGPYGQPLAEFWQRTVYPWMVANDQLGQPRYGISLDDAAKGTVAQAPNIPGLTAPKAPAPPRPLTDKPLPMPQ